MRAVVETVVRHLVDHPDHVDIEEIDEGRRVTFNVRVHEDDRGNLIGRGGGTAQALRTLLNGLGQRKRMRVDLEILD
ncbi:MAG TPA: KH domain-containing protein [Candidatus Krumholzibacteria bacterium]|nr:KH domain-containing protein [Candidatus Krumholzibacteria bacterium]